MYIPNFTRLLLGLEGTPDPSLAVVQAAVAKHGFTGYVGPDYKAAAPARTGGGTGTGTGSGGTGGTTHP
jgi:hypothetical protein